MSIPAKELTANTTEKAENPQKSRQMLIPSNMSRYFKNFTNELGEVHVKKSSENSDNERFSSHGKLYMNPKTNTYMIDYYGSKHKAQGFNGCGFFFSHKGETYIGKLEEE